MHWVYHKPARWFMCIPKKILVVLKNTWLLSSTILPQNVKGAHILAMDMRPTAEIKIFTTTNNTKLLINSLYVKTTMLIFYFHETISPLVLVIRIESLQKMIMLENLNLPQSFQTMLRQQLLTTRLKHPLYLGF